MKYPGLYLAALLFGVSPAAQSALTESRALETGMNQERIQTLLDARRTEAEGQRDSIGRWNNPEVEYARETLDLPGGESEEAIWQLSQRIDLAGVSRTQRKAADHAFQADEQRLNMERRRWRAEIRQRFYTLLAAKQRADSLQRYQQRLDELASIIGKRLARGEASRYDRLRIDQERTLVTGDFREASADYQSARASLFDLLNIAPEPVAGSLLPPSPEYENTETPVAGHPRLRALSAARDSARLEASAARREGWPRLTLGVGRKTLEEPGLEADGNVVLVGVELPLFDRGSGEARAADSRAARLRAELSLQHQALENAWRSAREKLKAQRTSAVELRASLEREDGTLTAIAETAYRAGEITIMELIDAYRTEMGTRQSYIDRALDARLTYIQLQRLRGN